MCPHDPAGPFVDGGNICEAVLAAVASAEGRSPEVLDPLYDAIDPEALDAVLRVGDDAGRRVVFEYHGYTVTAQAGGEVRLEPLGEG